MKGKRSATEQKIRILREADGGKSSVEVSKEHNIAEVTFDRWKRQFGQLDVNEAKRMKELERENAALKKMRADSLLKNRVLEAVNAKKWCARNTSDGWPPSSWKATCAPGEPRAGACDWRGRRFSIGCGRPTAERTGLVTRLHELSRKYPRYGFRRIAVKLRREGCKVGRKQVQKLRRAEGLRVPPPRRYVAGRGESTGLPTQAGPSWSRVDVGLQRGRHGPRRCPAHAHRPRRIHEGDARAAPGAPDRSAGGDRTGAGGDRRPRRAAVHPLRQRPGVHRQRTPALAGGAENKNHLHHPGEPLGERLRRIVPLPFSR